MEETPLHPDSRRIRSSRARRGATGIGLLGILVTLAVVGLIAGLAIPIWFARHDVTLDNAAILLARDLRAVQNRAAYLGEEARLELDSHGWRAVDARGAALTRFDGKERIERRLDADGVFEGVALGATSLGEDRSIGFGPTGEVLEGGWVELVFRGERRRLMVTAPSGAILIEGLTRPWSDDGR